MGTKGNAIAVEGTISHCKNYGLYSQEIKKMPFTERHNLIH